MKKIAIVLVAIAFVVSFGIAAYAAEKAEKPADNKAQPTGQVMPKKVQVDTNGDGKPDRAEYYNEDGSIAKVEADTNGDGMMDETVTYEKGKPVKSTKDTNKDGKPDVWVDF